MCERMTTLPMEAWDLPDSGTVAKPIVDAAFAAADTACCAKRDATVSRAVFDAATALGLRVAWTDPARTDARFIVWPADTTKTHTIREELARIGGTTITARMLAPTTPNGA